MSRTSRHSIQSETSTDQKASRAQLSRRQFLQGAATIAGVFALGPNGTLVEATLDSFRKAAQAAGGKLVFAAESMGDTLEPGVWTGFGSIHVMDNIGEGLTRSNFVDGKPTPGLAESWTVSADGLTYAFKIRSGAKFHDGTAIDAAAIVRSLTRYGNDKDVAYPKGAYMQGGHGDSNWEYVKATDAMTVEIKLKAADAAQLHRLARPSAYPISPAALDKFKTDIGLNMVTAGPFKVDKFTPGQEAVLSPFDGYYGGKPELSQLVIRGYPDSASILAAMEAGDVNFTLYAPFESIARLKKSDTLKVDVGPALIDLFIGASAKNAPSNNLDVRMAVNYAINRDNIIGAALSGFGELPASILSPTDLGFDPSLREISKQDVAKAKEHLAKSGLTLPIKIELAFENNRFWPQIAELVKADLDAVGFDVTLDKLDSGSFWGKVNDGKTTFSINQRSTFVPDPDDKVLILHSKRSPGGQTFHELLPTAPQLDKLIDDGLAEQDPAKRIEIYKQLQKFVLDVMPYIYLGYLTPPVFSGKGVSGIPLAAAAAGRATLRDVKVTA